MNENEENVESMNNIDEIADLMSKEIINVVEEIIEEN